MAACVPLFRTAELQSEGIEVWRVEIRRPGGVTVELREEMYDWLRFDPTPGVSYSSGVRGMGTVWVTFHITDPNVALAFKMRFA